MWLTKVTLFSSKYGEKYEILLYSEKYRYTMYLLYFGLLFMLCLLSCVNNLKHSKWRWRWFTLFIWMCRIVLCYSQLINSATQHVTTLLTAHCHPSSDVPRWTTTHVPRVVSTAWSSTHMYRGNRTTPISAASVVLTRRSGADGSRDVTSRRCDVTDSDSMMYSVSIHFSFCNWSTDTRQIQRGRTMNDGRSVMNNCRWVRQTTMSRGSVIPLTWMSLLSGLSVSALNVLMIGEYSQTTYTTLSNWATPVARSTTHNTERKQKMMMQFLDLCELQRTQNFCLNVKTQQSTSVTAWKAWRQQQTLWRYGQRTDRVLCLQPLVVLRVVVSRHSPNAVVPVSNVQLTTTVADDHVAWHCHSFDVNCCRKSM